jgi:uncharacterized protein YbcV (DUF1398 family)
MTMNQMIKKLMEAQKYAMSIRPKIGGFPILAEILRQAGVETNRWLLPSCQSIYIMDEGSVIQQGTPLITGMHEVPKFDRTALIAAIRTDQAGKSTFPEFLQSAWNAGVISYDVNFIDREVVYYGVRGERYVEEYPAVEVNGSMT